MQIKRFLGNIARTYLAISSLSMAAVAGADEVYHDSVVYHEPYGGCAPQGSAFHGFVPQGEGFQGFAPQGFAPQGCESEGCGQGCGSPCNKPPVCSWGYNPPAYTKCGAKNGCESFLDTLRFRADFLWWRASEEGLALGSEDVIDRFTVGDEVVFSEISRIKKPNNKYDAGFRIGLSSICDNCWDIDLNWTHFHTTSHARGLSDFTNPESITVFDSFWEGVIGVVPDSSASRWILDMDLIDLEFGHKYYVDHCFVLRPHAGLRGVRIDQHYRVFSQANRTGDVLFPAVYQSEVHAKNDFLGVGPRVGLDLEFKFCGGISIFGQAAGTIVFGKFDRNSNEVFDEFSGSPVDISFRSSPQRCSRAITDLAFGLKWDHCVEWCASSHPVSLAVTWEHHGFFDFNNFNFRSASSDPFGDSGFVASSNGARRNGDLFTQGVTVSAEIGF
jgi:Legionella pneumophila major outer membrane protein precursor